MLLYNELEKNGLEEKSQWNICGEAFIQKRADKTDKEEEDKMEEAYDEYNHIVCFIPSQNLLYYNEYNIYCIIRK